MSDRTDHVIALIDRTLNDLTVSGDAMRCMPEAPDPLPPIALRGMLRIAPVDTSLDSDDWVQVGYTDVVEWQPAYPPDGGEQQPAPDEEGRRQSALNWVRNRNTGPTTDPFRHRNPR